MIMSEDDKTALVTLGARLGGHHAFAVVANRCAAADAECLKAIRDSGDYKQLGLTWEEFCIRHVGMTRAYVEQHISCYEEYGENYRRMAEIMSMSPATYRLIGSAVSDHGLEFQGEYIPLQRENRAKIAAAVKTLRAERKSGKPAATTVASLYKGVDKLIEGAIGMANEPGRRAELIVLLERAALKIESLACTMRERTVLVE
jgi:hypothetical protein